MPICYAYHPLNAYDRPDGSVVIDLCVYDKMFDVDRNGPFGDSLARLERWEIDPVARKTGTTVIDATGQEFPRHAHSVGTREHRYGYSATVCLCNLFLRPTGEKEFLELPRRVYDTPEELLADGWRVD